MNAPDEFYIGWEAKAPVGIRSKVRLAVAGIALATVAVSLVLAFSQRTISVSIFEWGTLKDFSGIFKAEPYPHLLVSRPGASGTQTAFSSYYLVKPFKYGIEPATAHEFDGKTVQLRGTLIYRGNQTMIEVADQSLKTAPTASAGAISAASVAPVNLGWQKLVGEIVDSKCFLGVMNPGALAPHRACAIRCISGGCPPVLVVRQAGGSVLYFLLASAAGQPVNKEVLDKIAEPLEITGEVVQQGDLLILRADPATYRRLTP